MKQVINYNRDNGLLNMIGRTDPMIKDGANSYKDINYQKVSVNAIAGAAIAGGVGKFAKVKTNNEFKDVKATPPNAIKHKRAGQKRYSKSAQQRANQKLRKQKEEYSNKTEEYTNALLNVIYGYMKREPNSKQ